MHFFSEQSPIMYNYFYDIIDLTIGIYNLYFAL